MLELQHVVKSYGDKTALKDFSLKLDNGLFGLLGENGAGKSTLIKILTCNLERDGGSILFDGKEICDMGRDYRAHIGYLPQESVGYPRMRVGEFLEYIAALKGLDYDRKQLREIIYTALEQVHLEKEIHTRFGQLSGGMKRRLLFAQAVMGNPKILILDEPTAVLTPQETDELFIQLMKLREKGHTIIFISHKLDEIKKICDRATIMRNGRSMGTYDVKDISTQEMSRLMVGREVSLKFDKKEQHLTDDVFMRVRNLTVHNAQGVLKVDNLSFDLKGGEILGIAGVEGNGQSELIDTLTGLNKNYSGEVKIKGEDITKDSIEDIRELKLAHIPEDRMTSGCAGNLSIMENIFSNQYKDKKFSGRFLLKRKAMEQRSDELIKEYMVKCKSRKQNVGMLSGGNIQKVIVAREFSTGPDIIIANQPTRGIDVGAAAFIRKRLLEFRDAGCAVILISADLTEIFSLSDRLAVMYKGKFAGFFTDVENVTEDELGQHMLGIKHDDVLEGVLYE